MLKNIVLFLFVVLFTACGGGGGGSSTPLVDDDNPTQTISGYVVDNYIKNATVCIDSDKDNSCEDEEASYVTTTDENGSFSFDFEVSSDSIIIAYGGEDAITGVSFNHLIKNIATNIDTNDKVILSSINTLITEVYNESNTTLANAITLVNNFLGGTSKNIEETNIIEDVIANKAAQSDEFLRSLKLFQMVEKGADSIDSSLSIDIFNQLAKFILSDTNATHETSDINVTINSMVKNLYVQDPYPVFLLKPSVEVELGQTYLLDLNNSAVSPDGKNISYEVINDTNIFEINGTKIYFKSVPSAAADYIVTIEANNSVKTNDINLSISVVNDTPILQAISAQEIDEDNSLVLEINASDFSSSGLNYSASSSDSNVSISWNDNNLTLTPTANWYGVSNIQVVVDDGDKNASQSFIITVNNVNDIPTISGTPTTSTNQNIEYSFTPTSNDVDGDILLFSIVNQPSWLDFNTSSGKLSGTPDTSDIGIYNDINISVSDSVSTVSLPLFNINVTNSNNAPTANNIIFTINEDNNLTISESNFTDIYNDVDGDVLSKIYITSLETNGALTYDGSDVVLNQAINSSDISKLKFIPVANAYGTPYAVFKYLVNDGDLNSSQEYNVTINVKSVIDWNSDVDELDLLEDFGSYNLVIEDIDTDGSDANLSYSLDNAVLTLPSTQIVSDGSDVSIALNSISDENGEAILTLNLTKNSTTLFTKEINVTVTPVNDQPIHDSVDDMNISYGLNETVSITGIGAGGGTDEDNQTIYPYVTSSNSTIISSITNISLSGSTLSFDLVSGEPGVSDINVTLQDDGNNGVTGDNNTTSFTFEVRVRANGWKIYDDQKTSGYTINSVDFDGVSYDWDATNRWYETTNTILMPVKLLSQSYYEANNFNKVADGHYYVDKSVYIYDTRKTGEHTVESSYLTVSGTSKTTSLDDFQHDPVHYLFVSSIIRIDGENYDDNEYLEWTDMNQTDGNNSSFITANDENSSFTTAISLSAYANASEKIDSNNDGNSTDSLCAEIYGEGWRLPTAYEVGINTFGAEGFNGYIPSYMGDAVAQITTSSEYSTSSIWSIHSSTGGSIGMSKTSNLKARCVYY